MTELLQWRRIKSFVQRKRGFSSNQEKIWQEALPQYNLPSNQIWDFACIFGNAQPVSLEIGFGNGENLFNQAQAEPGYNYLGIEVYLAGICELLGRVQEQQLSNVRVSQQDAVQALRANIPDASLSRVQIYFPDPWPKRRHHKRRLIQPEFIELLNQKLSLGAELCLATDWEDYAYQMLQVLEAEPDLVNTYGAFEFAPRNPQRILTKFEQRGQQLQHKIYDLSYQKLLATRKPNGGKLPTSS